MNHFTFTERSDEAMMAEVRTITTDPRGPRPPSRIPCRRPPTRSATRPSGTSTSAAREAAPKGVVGPIHGDREVVQTFVCEEDTIDKVEIMMATYARTNRCTVIVELHADSADGPVLARREIAGRDARSTTTGSAWSSRPSRTPGAAGSPWSCRSPDAGPDDTVTAYYTSAAVPGREALTVARREKAGNILHFHTRWSKQ